MIARKSLLISFCLLTSLNCINASALECQTKTFKSLLPPEDTSNVVIDSATPITTPSNSSAYCEANSSIRLFMAPDVLYCGDGPGAIPLDTLTPIENWVENNIALETIIATNIAKKMTRTLCLYPKIVILNKGINPDNITDTNNASNFHCE